MLPKPLEVVLFYPFLAGQFNLTLLRFRRRVYEVITMYMVGKIRRMHFREGMSVREIVRRAGLSRNTVRT